MPDRTDTLKWDLLACAPDYPVAALTNRSLNSEVNMSSVISRACSFVVFGGLVVGACASPSGPSATPSSQELPASGGASELTALSPGVTDATLMKAGWSCLEPGPGVTVCAPPGMGLPSIPPVPNNGGPPSYNLAAFVNHQFDHHVRFLRPDLFHGQPCVGGEPMDYFALLDYYQCIIPLR